MVPQACATKVYGRSGSTDLKAQFTSRTNIAATRNTPDQHRNEFQTFRMQDCIDDHCESQVSRKS